MTKTSSNVWPPETQSERRGHRFLTDDLIRSTPRLRRSSTDRIVYLHYFGAVGDWWLIELDPSDWLGFGFARLSSMPEMAEWGYVSLVELETLSVHAGLVIVERDCFWAPTPFEEIRRD